MKDKKNEYLLSKIGEIDDRYLDEALSYRPKKRNAAIWLIPAAACICLLFALSLMRPLLARFSDLSAEEKPNGAGEAKPFDDLDSVLADAGDRGHSKVHSFESLSYITGEASLVWQYESGEIFSAPLSKAELFELQKGLGKGSDVGSEKAELRCKVWILDGQGNVVTPYLKASGGNVGRVVFDYEAEIYPSREVIDCISKILSRN